MARGQIRADGWLRSWEGERRKKLKVGREKVEVGRWKWEGGMRNSEGGSETEDRLKKMGG